MHPIYWGWWNVTHFPGAKTLRVEKTGLFFVMDRGGLKTLGIAYFHVRKNSGGILSVDANPRYKTLHCIKWVLYVFGSLRILRLWFFILGNSIYIIKQEVCQSIAGRMKWSTKLCTVCYIVCSKIIVEISSKRQTYNLHIGPIVYVQEVIGITFLLLLIRVDFYTS